MLILQNISYTHPDNNPLFDNFTLTVNHHDKIALIGNNGSGKSIVAQNYCKQTPTFKRTTKCDIASLLHCHKFLGNSII